jgi:hypothetical protein
VAKFVITTPSITINSVDLSDHIASVTINESFADVTTTAFGSTNVTRVAGLGDHSISLEFHEDYAASEVHATINPLVGTTTTVTVTPVSGDSVSATNPKFSMTVLCTEWQQINGAVGDLATASVTWPISGDVSVLTS